MNQKTVKQLRKIMGYQSDSPEQKRHFKRLKKQYKSLSKEAKPIFIKKLEKIYDVNSPHSNLKL